MDVRLADGDAAEWSSRHWRSSPRAAGAATPRRRASDSGSQEPIKIGAILSLTGTYAGLGEPEKNLIEMEVKKINDEGGINGRPVEVIIEDDHHRRGPGRRRGEPAHRAGRRRRHHRRHRHRARPWPSAATCSAPDAAGLHGRRHRHHRPGRPAGVRHAVVQHHRRCRSRCEYLKDQGITKIGLITDSGGFGKDGQAVFAAEAPRPALRSSPTRRSSPAIPT